MSKIARIYTELLRNARRTGQRRSADLAGGARLVVEVVEGQITLTIGRAPQRVGDREIIVFCRDCGVPDGALRYPAVGQASRRIDGVSWWLVAFRWIEEPAPQIDLDPVDLPPIGEQL